MHSKLITLLIFSFLLMQGKAQNATKAPGDSTAKAESIRLEKLNQQLAGTFQIQVVKSREIPVFPMRYLDVITALRSATDTVYYTYPYKPNMRLMILPKVVTDKPNFIKPQRIAYVAH